MSKKNKKFNKKRNTKKLDNKKNNTNNPLDGFIENAIKTGTVALSVSAEYDMYGKWKFISYAVGTYIDGYPVFGKPTKFRASPNIFNLPSELIDYILRCDCIMCSDAKTDALFTGLSLSIKEIFG